MKTLGIILLLLCLPNTAVSETYLCSGVWRSKPCSTLYRVIGETEARSALEIKQEIAANLDRFAKTIEAELGHTDFEAGGVAAFCAQEHVSVDECRARALRADKALSSFYQNSMKLRQRETELALKQEELALRREKMLRDAGHRKHHARGAKNSRKKPA